jgi:hypothetical protein
MRKPPKLPRDWVRDKDWDKELTEILKKPKPEPKAKSKYPDYPFNTAFVNLTMEELERIQIIEDCIISIEIRCIYQTHDYYVLFDWEDLDDDYQTVRAIEGEIHVKRYEHSEKDLKKVAALVAAYYATKEVKFYPNSEGRINIQDPKRLSLKNIIDDLRNFFMVTFENVNIEFVRFVNVIAEDLKVANLPEDKMAYHSIKE